MSTHAGLRRARQVLAAVINPKMRQALGGSGSGSGGRGGLERFDWVDPDGRVDVPQLRESMAVIESLLDDTAILRFDRVSQLPSDDSARRNLSLEIVALVLRRLGSPPRVSEERLNAALAMVVEDFSVVRRDAVDAGLLDRTPDGRTYSLRRTAPE
ncbi:DUF2087 domain-containing protein [Curtobacterium sp. ISL-83]|uniref:DUF2087 domain-containing protein n=1 Tax=Curtobacterium sp. ISL-83 TaxID=2819145 RepID=UPI001BEC8FAF|nr:DUF2087 domain-containing protein [Curtobacterium sp. ISL-83]MBT2501867.1 DUF2087 domain-containing protein [Curtobacterium sp. ISL-83]